MNFTTYMVISSQVWFYSKMLVNEPNQTYGKKNTENVGL